MTTTNLDATLFRTTTKRASDLNPGDQLDISPHIEVVAHVELLGGSVRGYFHTGRQFRYSPATQVSVLEMV